MLVVLALMHPRLWPAYGASQEPAPQVRGVTPPLGGPGASPQPCARKRVGKKNRNRCLGAAKCSRLRTHHRVDGLNHWKEIGNAPPGRNSQARRRKVASQISDR